MTNRHSLNLPNIKIPNKPIFNINKKSSNPFPRLPLSPKAHNHIHDPSVPCLQEEYDILYEHQRGFYILGIPKYSANLLNPMDPPALCDRNMKGVTMDINTFPLPDPTWEWADEQWMIDMSGDVDPHGWQYAFHFKHHTWRGDSKAFHNFVRRRRWIRLRRKKPDTDAIYIMNSLIASPTCLQPTTPSTLKSEQSSDTSSLEPLNSFENSSKLIQELKNSRIDRERIILIQEDLSKRNGSLNDGEVDDILKLLDYDSSRRKVLKLIEEMKIEYPKEEIVKNRRNSVPFFSDLKALTD